MRNSHRHIRPENKDSEYLIQTWRHRVEQQKGLVEYFKKKVEEEKHKRKDNSG